MNIAIIGAGNAGSTIAADLTLKGHRVSLLKTSQKLHNDHFNVLLNNGGKINLVEDGVCQVASLYRVTTCFPDALTDDIDVIIIYVQTIFQEQVVKAIEPFLHDNQIVLFEPGYLGSMFLIKNTSKKIISVEAESSPIDCRIIKPGVCKVLFRNIVNPIGVFPKNKAGEVMQRLECLGYNFESLHSVLEAALHNPNLIVHTVGSLMSIPRIEFSGGEYWMYKEVFTPMVWNMVEALDKEKNLVLKKYCLPELSYVEACKLRNKGHNSNIDAKAAFFDYAKNNSPKGPTIPNSRYLIEDISQGLCLMESLAQIVNVDVPVCSSIINLASASLDTNLRQIGRSVIRDIDVLQRLLEHPLATLQ